MKRAKNATVTNTSEGCIPGADAKIQIFDFRAHKAYQAKS
jgi:hypothetical protein